MSPSSSNLPPPPRPVLPPLHSHYQAFGGPSSSSNTSKSDSQTNGNSSITDSESSSTQMSSTNTEQQNNVSPVLGVRPAVPNSKELPSNTSKSPVDPPKIDTQSAENNNQSQPQQGFPLKHSTPFPTQSYQPLSSHLLPDPPLPSPIFRSDLTPGSTHPQHFVIPKRKRGRPSLNKPIQGKKRKENPNRPALPAGLGHQYPHVPPQLYQQPPHLPPYPYNQWPQHQLPGPQQQLQQYPPYAASGQPLVAHGFPGGHLHPPPPPPFQPGPLQQPVPVPPPPPPPPPSVVGQAAPLNGQVPVLAPVPTSNRNDSNPYFINYYPFQLNNCPAFDGSLGLDLVVNYHYYCQYMFERNFYNEWFIEKLDKRVVELEEKAKDGEQNPRRISVESVVNGKDHGRPAPPQGPIIPPTASAAEHMHTQPSNPQISLPEQHATNVTGPAAPAPAPPTSTKRPLDSSTEEPSSKKMQQPPPTAASFSSTDTKQQSRRPGRPPGRKNKPKMNPEYNTNGVILEGVHGVVGPPVTAGTGIKKRGRGRPPKQRPEDRTVEERSTSVTLPETADEDVNTGLSSDSESDVELEAGKENEQCELDSSPDSQKSLISELVGKEQSKGSDEADQESQNDEARYISAEENGHSEVESVHEEDEENEKEDPSEQEPLKRTTRSNSSSSTLQKLSKLKDDSSKSASQPQSNDKGKGTRTSPRPLITPAGRLTRRSSKGAHDDENGRRRFSRRLSLIGSD